MKTKKIALFVVVIICLGIISSLSTVSAVESPQLVEGTYTRISQELFQNHLWVESTGLCVMGMHTYGASTKTDIVVVGGTGHSAVSLQGYYPNMSNHIPVDYHNEATWQSEKIRDSVKFLNPNNGNMELIYASGYNDGTPKGRIYKQDFVNPSKDGDNNLLPEWYVTTTGEVYALTLGNFDSNAGDLEVAGVTMEGVLYVINNIQTTGFSTLTEDFSDIPWIRGNSAWVGDKVKTPIAAIDDLDGNNPTQSDIVVGHYQNVTAISTNTSNRVIWDVNVGFFPSDIVVVDDINTDGLQDVVVATSNGLYLLDGADGTELANTYEAGAFCRDVEIYNSTAVITGNDDGDIYVWNVDTTSPSFDDMSLGVNWGRDINDLLNVGDLNSDGIDEFAVGADTLVGVVDGDTLVSIWTDGPNGWTWNGGSIDVLDMELLEDLNGDGFGDLAVTGYGSSEGAVFVFSSYGQLHFQPDLYGSGSVDSDCEEDSEYNFVFTATVYQLEGLSAIAEISLDDEAWQSMTQGSGTWETGMTFTYTHTGGFPSGDHTYKFRFTDTFPDVYTTTNKSFQVGGDCGGGGGLDIPGAGIWMIFTSIGVGIAITLLTIRKHLKH
ncbi:MAG: hypothetical protein ACTSRD_02410 [Promethearchaeota archaeon]